MNTFPLCMMTLTLQVISIQKYDFSLKDQINPRQNFLENQLREFKTDNYYYKDSTNPIIIQSWNQGSLSYELNQMPDTQDFPPQLSIDQDKQKAIIIHSKEKISQILKFKKEYRYSISNTLTNFTYIELITCQYNLQFLKVSHQSQITNSIKPLNKIPKNDIRQQSNYYFYDLLSENQAKYYLELPIQQSVDMQPKFVLKFQSTDVKIKYSDFVQDTQGVFYQINSESIFLQIPPIISKSNVDYEQITFVITLLEKEFQCEFNEKNDQMFEIIQTSKIIDAQITIPKPNKTVNFMRVISKISISNVVVTLPIIELEFHFPPPPILSNSNSYLLIFFAILAFAFFVYKLNRAK